MDTVEIIVYLAVAILVGGLLLLAVGRMTNSGLYESVKDMFLGDDTEEFTKVTDETLPELLFTTWESCGLGTTERAVTFQYTGAGIGKTDVFAKIKALRLCRTLSSVQEDCGTREDLVMPQLVEGTVYEARCDTGLQQLVVS
ncbi:MAG: hypothetical protein OXR66_06820 [Candidatus Woesearchaeota archaeon]|nr:hypothetical protein [Candidatus Woesearchaeota archaeon]